MRIKIVTLAKTTLLALLCLSAFGCATVEGFGKDVSKAGEHLEEAAEDAQN